MSLRSMRRKILRRQAEAEARRRRLEDPGDDATAADCFRESVDLERLKRTGRSGRKDTSAAKAASMPAFWKLRKRR